MCKYICFNPLKIGSYCNIRQVGVKSQKTAVSIPLKSGHIVIIMAYESNNNEQKFQSP